MIPDDDRERPRYQPKPWERIEHGILYGPGYAYDLENDDLLFFQPPSRIRVDKPARGATRSARRWPHAHRRSCLPDEVNDLSRLSRFKGCLLGGAVGDALGAPVEFLSLAEIRSLLGAAGIVDYAPAYGRTGAITDDSQMTLFTAEGLLRADNRWLGKGICHVPSVVRHAYLRWLYTQGEEPAENPFSQGGIDWPDGWLISVEALHARRAPGTTCLSALHEPRLGTLDEPLNDSKGCGAVMRMAPVGLFAGLDDAFELGCELGALTHGHPSGYLAAGFLARLIAGLVEDIEFDAAIDFATAELCRWDGHEECFAAVEAARQLAEAGAPTAAEKVESLGQGWVAEEALAIALYCALAAENFEQAVCLAVNHGGDSDSTGAITGNILGALHGEDAIPARWLDQLELRNEIEQIAADLARLAPTQPGDHPFDAPIPDWDRYPGW